jgi:hypothetical protein
MVLSPAAYKEKVGLATQRLMTSQVKGYRSTVTTIRTLPGMLRPTGRRTTSVTWQAPLHMVAQYQPLV